MFPFISDQGVFPTQYETVTPYHAPGEFLSFVVAFFFFNKVHNNQLKCFSPEFHRHSIQGTE